MNTILSIGGRLLQKDFLLFFLFLKVLILSMFLLLETDSYSVHAGSTQNEKMIILEEEQENTKSIFPPKTIRIIHNDEEHIHITYSDRVEEILDEFEIDYSENDNIIPALDADIDFIRVITIESMIEKYEEIEIAIPFEVERVYDNTLDYGKVVILQYGQNGIREETYKYIYLNDTLTSKEKESSEIIAEAQTQIEKIGTKRAALEGRNCSHWSNVIENVTSDNDERDVLKFLIKCESNCNAGANNSNTYIGLLQFSPRTFEHYSGGGDIWDGEAQIQAALTMIRGGGLAHHWPACANKHCSNNSSKFCAN